MSLKLKTYKYWINIYLYNNRLILPIKRTFKNNYISNLILLVLSPYIIINYLFSIIYEKIIGFKLTERLINKEKNKRFDYELAFVCISKNEGPYIKEWIEFHKLVGVSKFYFFDNESNDDTYNILQPYIKSGLVDYFLVKGKAKQLIVYNEAIRKYKNYCRWMGFIDMDEYVIPVDNNKKIWEVVNELVYKAKKGAAGVGINWAIYGTSGLKTKPHGLIMENYTMRAHDNYSLNIHIKTICNPRLVKEYISPHYPFYKRGAYSITEGTNKRLYGWGDKDILYKNLRINHYYTKSEEEYIAKRNRGLGDRVGRYNEQHFCKYNKNDVEDNIMSFYIPIIKSAILDNQK